MKDIENKDELLKYYNDYFKDNKTSLDNIMWGSLINKYKLSEEFIEKFKDVIPPETLSSVCVLPITYINKYWDTKYIIKEFILKYQHINYEFLKLHNINEDNKYIKSNYLFNKYNKDWFIAYVNINLNNTTLNINSNSNLNKHIKNLNKKIWINNIKDTQHEYHVLNSRKRKIVMLKVKVYYKDLISTFTTTKVHVIRIINKYKI